MDDERIIELIRVGHSEVFSELVSRYQKQAHFLALRYMRDWAEADEITQKAFIKLYTFIMNSKDTLLVLPWIRRVVINLCLDKHKNKKWRLFSKHAVRSVKPDHGDKNTEDLFNGIRDNRSSPEHALLNQELGKNIDTQVERLPDQQKKIFIMKHFEGLKIKDIAQQLNVSQGQIKSQLFRAVHTLRRGLGEFYEEG